MGEAAEKLDSYPGVLLGCVSTGTLAAWLGKKNARAGRDWCKRHGVPLTRDGKTNWARVEDVERALAKIGIAKLPPSPPDRAATIEASFSAFKTGVRRGT